MCNVKDKSRNDDMAQLTSATKSIANNLQLIFDAIGKQAVRLQQFFETEEGKNLIVSMGKTAEFLQQAEARLKEQDRISLAIAKHEAESQVANLEAQERIAAALKRIEQEIDECRSDDAES